MYEIHEFFIHWVVGIDSCYSSEYPYKIAAISLCFPNWAKILLLLVFIVLPCPLPLSPLDEELGMDAFSCIKSYQVKYSLVR